MKTNKIRITTRSKRHLPCLSWRLRPDSTSAGDMKIMPAIHSRSQDARAGCDSFASIQQPSVTIFGAYEDESPRSAQSGGTIKSAQRKYIPVLCICRGAPEMNRESSSGSGDKSVLEHICPRNRVAPTALRRTKP